jgi:tetratricopeptide (TPR) repeat protein
VIEIQFGIASAASRLAFFTVAAVIAGAQAAAADESRPHTVRSVWIVAAAFAGALSPWLSTLPSVINNPITSGSEDQFIAYLAMQSVATPLLYAGFLLLAIVIARASAGSRRTSSTWWQLPALAIAGWLVVPLSIVPSRADAFSAAAQSYGSDARWPEATIAFGAAAREAPSVPDYHDGLGRASIEWALRSTSPSRDQLLAQARASYERAIALDEFEPTYRRHLAAYFRIRASLLEGSARDEALLEADRIYARVTAWAPTLTPLWIEWAWVDVDRGRPSEGIEKLDRALSLDPQRGDAQRLRAELLEGRAPVR